MHINCVDPDIFNAYFDTKNNCIYIPNYTSKESLLEFIDSKINPETEHLALLLDMSLCDMYNIFMSNLDEIKKYFENCNINITIIFIFEFDEVIFLSQDKQKNDSHIFKLREQVISLSTLRSEKIKLVVGPIFLWNGICEDNLKLKTYTTLMYGIFKRVENYFDGFHMPLSPTLIESYHKLMHEDFHKIIYSIRHTSMFPVDKHWNINKSLQYKQYLQQCIDQINKFTIFCKSNNIQFSILRQEQQQ